jgi:hypothetical protein
MEVAMAVPKTRTHIEAALRDGRIELTIEVDERAAITLDGHHEQMAEIVATLNGDDRNEDDEPILIDEG